MTVLIASGYMPSDACCPSFIRSIVIFFFPPFCFLGDGGGVGLSFSYCKHSAVADMAPASPLKIELFIEVSVACKIFGIA